MAYRTVLHFARYAICHKRYANHPNPLDPPPLPAPPLDPPPDQLEDEDEDEEEDDDHELSEEELLLDDEPSQLNTLPIPPTNESNAVSRGGCAVNADADEFKKSNMLLLTRFNPTNEPRATASKSGARGASAAALSKTGALDAEFDACGRNTGASEADAVVFCSALPKSRHVQSPFVALAGAYGMYQFGAGASVC